VDELTLPIIPRPETVRFTDATCRFPQELYVTGNAADEAMAEWRVLHSFAEVWLPDLTLATTVGRVTPPLVVSFDSSLPEEGYRLEIKTDSLRLAAAKQSGLFYGLLTLLQLLTSATQEDDEFVLPAVEIEDRPRFRWRGMHLDVARHFFPVDVIKRYLDVLALHKINVFHWHLTDDQGWRIEIRKHPELTEIGAWRIEEDGSRYGGFYTQDEIREVVRYATERFITIVPEIEMPGHARAVLAAFQELSCTGEAQSVPTTWGVFDDVYCAGNDDVFSLLENVLAEVCELFPGEYVHIGGDECPKTYWQVCPKCQSRLEDEGLSNFDQLQAWFVRQAEQILYRHGKRLIGWDEIMDGGLSPSAAVMAWRSPEHGRIAAEVGHDVVMSPTSHCYFDYAQAKHDEPVAFEAVLTLDQVAEFDPAPESWPEAVRKHIIGGQGNLWTERIDNEPHLQYMLLPRLCALSERLWSPPHARSHAAYTEMLTGWIAVLEKLGFRSRSV